LTKPVGNNGTFFQKFEFNAGAQVLTNDNQLEVRQAEPARFEVEKDFRPSPSPPMARPKVRSFSRGMVCRHGQGRRRLRLIRERECVEQDRACPALRAEEVEAKRRQELNRYAGLRYKAMLAQSAAPKRCCLSRDPTRLTPANCEALLRQQHRQFRHRRRFNFQQRRQRVAPGLKDLKSLQSALDKDDPHAEGGFTLSNVTVRITTAVEHLKKDDRNVLASLPPSSNKGPVEWVVVGAHYDHLGFGETGAMQRKGEEGRVHAGADDNASGTAAVLELAASLAEEVKSKPGTFQRGVVFALWSGEEIGLIGSSHFVEHSPVPLSNVVAYVNFDMVGRLRENKLSLQGVGSSATWRRLVERRNVVAGFNLSLQEDPYLPTDVTAFYSKTVPVLNFFTGGHDDYHRPTDTAEKLDYEGLERITHRPHLIMDLVKGGERPDYVRVQQSDKAGSRETLRVYLGTIPDYATEVAGVKLSGTRGGSLADKAG
jgi:hypothetical protein